MSQSPAWGSEPGRLGQGSEVDKQLRDDGTCTASSIAPDRWYWSSVTSTLSRLACPLVLIGMLGQSSQLMLGLIPQSDLS